MTPTSSTALKQAEHFSTEPLFAHQRLAAEFIKANPCCALFAGMGTGKTLAAATAAQELIYGFEVFRVLIVAPKRVALFTWPDEFEKWDHLTLDYQVIKGDKKSRQQSAAMADKAIHVINIENLHWLVMLHGKDWPYDMVIIDESSLFKNHQTKRFRALRKVLPAISRVVLLSGTPAPNSLMDLWPQFFLLDQGKRLLRTFTSFRDNYFTSDYMGYNWELRPGAEQQIYDAVSDITLRLDTKDYIDLPELHSSRVTMHFSAAMLRRYKAFEKDALLQLGDETITAPHAGALVNKLLQYASGAIYAEDKRVELIHDHKMDALDEIVQTAAGEPVLVAYNFRHELDRLKTRYPKARTIDDKNALADWNAGKVPMLLAHPASAGHGLNLQHGGRRIVWLGLSWSLELYQQFNARLHRQGQTETVIINHLVVEGTAEETVLEVLQKKDAGQSALLNALRNKARAEGVL